MIWFLPLGESEAQRLKTELEARGERFTQEALGLGTTNDDPAWSVIEETMPRFSAMSDAQVDAARGVKHESDRAFTNLLTMARCCQYHRETASLVGQMTRVAVTGLTMDAVWQALQAPGWSEARLNTIQRELAAIELLSPVAGTFEIERIAFLQELAKYREGGAAHLQDLAKQLGLAPMKSDVWKQRLHHTPFEGNPIRYDRRPDARFALWAQDAAGQPQSIRRNPLTWPASM